MSKAALLGADVVRGAVAVPGDEPGGVVVGNELLQPLPPRSFRVELEDGCCRPCGPNSPLAVRHPTWEAAEAGRWVVVEGYKKQPA